VKHTILDLGFKVAGLKKFYADEHGTYYVGFDGEQKVIHWVGSESLNFNQMEVNGDMIAVIMGAEEDYKILKDEPMVELPKVYIADGWKLLKANEGLFKNYVLFKEELGTLRFTRIVYIRDMIHGINQISINKEVGEAFIAKLAELVKYKKEEKKESGL
jgi:hypothetical protein